MRLLLLEPDPGRAQMIRQALLEVAGASVQLALADSLGELGPLLEGSPDAVVLPDRLPESGQDEGAAEALLLSWYIARRCPKATLWLWQQERSGEREADAWLPDGRARCYPFPRESGELREWAEALRQHHGLAHDSGHKHHTWWQERRWLVVDSSGETLAQHALDDPELAADLLEFLSLKADQIAESLGQPGWSQVGLRGAERQAEVLHLEDRTRALALRDSRPVPRLPKKLLRKLEALRLAAPCT